jgi:cadmium resistance protein CadD (predicted permease)
VTEAGPAVGLFAITNIDDLVILVLFFGRAAGRPGAAARVVAGQYLGFAGTVAVSVLGALGAAQLPESVLPYLGLVPIALGLRAAWQLRRQAKRSERLPAVGLLPVAAVTFANGGDNIGVYVPVFSRSDLSGITVYVVVFMVLVAVWCAVGRVLVSHRVVAQALAKWGDYLLPVVLIAIGVLILLS